MTKKLGYLDSLRGLAALIVVLWHFAADFFPAMITMDATKIHVTIVESWIRDTPLAVIYSGAFAVCLFFVLSGYVLTYKFFQHKDEEIVVSGAMRRYVRLLIPVLTSILLAYLLMIAGLIFNKDAAVITKSEFLGGFYNFMPNLAGALSQAFYGVFFTTIPGGFGYNEVLWTMQIELFGSMLVFALALFLIRLRSRRLLYYPLLFLFLNTYYMGFILGMILSDLYNSNDKDRFQIKNRALITALLFFGLFLGSYTQGSQHNPIYQIMNTQLFSNNVVVYYSLGASLIMVALLNSDTFKTILTNKYLVLLGEISFSVYVLHRIVICSFSSWLFVLLSHSTSYLTAFVVTFIVSMVIILFSSYLFYFFIDLNGIRLSKWIFETFFSIKRSEVGYISEIKTQTNATFNSLNGRSK